MKRINLFLTLISLGIILILGVSYFGKLPKTPQPKIYVSQQYGYGFTYPGTFQVLEYSPAYVAIGTTTRDAFNAIANIDVVTAELSSKESFEDFVHRSAMNMCAADGPHGSIRCVGVVRSSGILTRGGLQGELFSLKQINESLPSHATTTVERGPFFAFNISPNVPDKKFAALIVHVPIAGADDTSHITEIEQIIDSLSLTKLDASNGRGVLNPPGTTTPVEVTTTIGKKVSALGVSITPIKVLDDSRCAVDVQCVWAGTVQLQILLESGLGSATSTISFERGVTTEAETVTLQKVQPAKHSTVELSPSDYSFTFIVSKR